MNRPKRDRRRPRSPARTLGVLLGLGLVSACGDEGPATTVSRGMPPNPNAKGGVEEGKDPPSTARAAAPGPGADDGGEIIDEGPERPPIVLDEKSFSRRRDPFRTVVVSERLEPEPDSPRAARQVQLGQYGFEDLRLVIIVNAGRGIKPRAQFVAGDGRSGTVMQGEYFSSAEVLLAAVNRDYVEVEVVDEELASALGLKRGERRSIFLRND